MKRWLVFAVAAIAIAGFTTVSFAAVTGSHHDMTTWTGDTTRDTCYPCHGIKAEATAPPAALGTVGGLCYARCHGTDSGAAGAIQIDADYPEIGVWDNANRRITVGSYTATTVDKYGTGAHGMNRGLTPAPDTAAMVQLSTYPYTDCTTLQCTSCHDVHSNQYTPFLRANLTGATVIASFCETCHRAGDAAGARWVTITAAPNGSHPSNVTDWSTAAATRANNGRRGRTILLKDVTPGGAVPANAGDNAVFRNISPMSTALNAAGPSVAGNRYNPGGKLGVAAGAVVTTTSGAIGCYTCHATHLPAAAGNSQLIVANYKGTVNQSDMCVGCHGGNTAYTDNTNAPANPGTTAYFHPVEYDSHPTGTWTSSSGLATSTWMVSTGAFEITVNLDNGYNVPVGNTSRVLLCASCHTANSGLAGVHNSLAGSMLLNPRKPSCESCHNTVARITGTAPNSHHIYGGTVNYNTAANGGYNTTVNYNGTQTGVLTDGLQCNDCHTFNGTAHNW